MKRIMVVTAFMVIAVSCAAFAADDISASEDRDLIEQLNLTPKQVEQVRTQQRTRTQEQARIQEQIRVKEKALKDELAKEDPNKEKVKAMVQELNRIRSKEFEDKVNAVMETKKILTREQLREMTKLQLKDGTGSQYKHRTMEKRGTQKGK
jgi:Spy/CpxP family protein refolding chaperone